MKWLSLSVLLFLQIITIAQSRNLSLLEILSKDKDQILVCGHRGGYYPEIPENSLSMFNDLGQHNPIMVEVDIRKDINGVLWLMHDENLERTTNGNGLLSSKTTKELKKLNLKNQNGLITNEHIPKFADILDFIAEKPIYLMLDIKDDSWAEALRMIEQKKLANKCLVLTFKPENTAKALRYSPNALISVLIKDSTDRENLLNLKLPESRLAAYVTDETPKEIIRQVRPHVSFFLSDARELWNNHKVVQNSVFYQKMCAELSLNILVTDFPLEVPDLLLKTKQINNLHLKKFDWLVNGNIDSLAILLHDDVYYVHSNGWLETKQDVLEDLKTKKLIYSDIKVHQSSVRLFGETAIVNGKGTFTVIMDSKPLEINLYYTEVYNFLPEGIRLISRHACKY